MRKVDESQGQGVRDRAEWRLEVHVCLRQAGLSEVTSEAIQKLALAYSLSDLCVPSAQPHEFTSDAEL
jgi:hypothetical protein